MFAASKSCAHRTAVAGTFALAACALIAPTALAFHKHLTSEQVREAYFIGRDQNHREAFFAAYTHGPQQPNTGPNVQSIEFRTPYEQIALRALDAGDAYFLPDAEQNYVVDPVHEVIVRVLIYENPTYTFPSAQEDSPEVLARLFKYRVSRDGRILEVDHVTAENTISMGAGSGGSGSFAGVDVRLHLDVSQFKSSDPVTIEVTTSGGQTYSTTFDVARLQ
jgi:hypothetical protein